MRRGWWLALVVLGGCVTPTPPQAATPATPPPDPLAAERAATAQAVAGAHDAWLRAQRERDDALWSHWRTAAPLPTSPADGGWRSDMAALLRRADALDAGSPAERSALRWADDDRRRALAIDDVEAELTFSLTALTFNVAGKELTLKDVPRQLASEPSAIKRRALWVASQPAADHARLVLARRRTLQREAVDGGVPWTPWLEQRGLSAAELAALAEAILTATEPHAAAAVARLSANELKLPPDKLGRADLPRLLKAPQALDELLPPGEVARRLRGLCAAPVPCASPALTVDLTDAASKHPLPLLLPARRAGDPVRLSLRPHGGALDLAMTTAELGAAWGLVAGPRQSAAGAGLFAGLAHAPAWLEGPGVPPALAAQLAAFLRARRLVEVRRAAGLVLVELTSSEGDDRRTAQLLTRALGLPHTPADAQRAWVELERPELAAAAVLSALAGAAAWDGATAALGPTWWTSERASERIPGLLGAVPSALDAPRLAEQLAAD